MTYWNDKCRDLTEHLWIPTENDMHWDPDERYSFKCEYPYISFNYYNGGNIEIDPHLKFQELPVIDKSSAKIKLEERLEKREMTRFFKESNKGKLSDDKILEKHFIQMDKIQEKVKKLDGFIRSHSVQILPTIHQKKIIQSWLYDCTSVYNKLVSHFTQIYDKYLKIAIDKTDNAKNKWKLLGKILSDNSEFPLNFQNLRALKIKEYTEDYYKTPYCIIADIIKEFVANAKGNITKQKDGQIKEFRFKHRRYNRVYHSIPLESHYTTEKGFYPSFLGVMKTNDKNFVWQNIEHDYKLIYDKYTDKYYVNVPKYVYAKEVDVIRKPIAIMDPGERVFQMLYGLDHVIPIGENMRIIFKKYLESIDLLKTKLNQKGKRKYNKKLKKKTRLKKHKYKKAIDRYHKKMDNIQRELHYKTAIYLCEHYDRIMVTDFSSKRVNSNDNDLDAMTKRVLQKLSHYRFRQRLEQKCQEYGCQYLEVSEAYTSKTCCRCGNVNKLLGTNKIYDCKKCGNKTGRDINGAIGIFLKNHELVLC